MKISPEKLKRSWDNNYRESQQKPWRFKLISVIVIIFITTIIIQALAPEIKKGLEESQESGSIIDKGSTTPTLTPTNTPVPSPIKTDDYLNQLYGEMNKATSNDITVSVDTDRGFIQATRQENEGWWVVQIMNWWPEFGAGFAIKSITRDFIYQVYHSDKNIKQVGITIQSGGKYSRAFVGINQAKKLKEDDWQYLQATNFYNWIKEVETSREEPDRANATFLEENL